MRVKLVILFALIFLLIFQILYTSKPATLYKRGVKIGEVNLSHKTWKEGEKIIEAIFNKPIYLNIESTSRAVTLREIGIDVDTDVLSRYTQTCKLARPSLFCKNTSNEPVNPDRIIIRNQEVLNTYLNSLENEFQFIAKNTIISFDDYSFRTLSPNAQILIDRTAFFDEEKINSLISKESIKIKIETTAEDNIEDQHKETNSLIDKMAIPLLIKYGSKPIYITGEEIRSFVKTEERERLLYGTLSDASIGGHLNTLKQEYESEDVKIVFAEAVNAIKRAVLYRAADYTINNAVILPIEGNPRTDGTLHEVYLEVVKPQQRLYRFENGELVKTYIISTGLTWDTTAGKYEIQGKQKLTVSYFGNWYMPDYLPIGTLNGEYRFGFHAIPYHMDAAGNIYSRDSNTMGSPATGGCIQLKSNEAEELFNWAKVGIPVYIYD